MAVKIAGDEQEYIIHIREVLEKEWMYPFEETETRINHSAAEGTGTLLTARLDQSGLRGLLNQLWDLNLTILAVGPGTQDSGKSLSGRNPTTGVKE